MSEFESDTRVKRPRSPGRSSASERVGQVQLEQAVVAQHLERHALARAREPHAVVGLSGGEAHRLEPLDHGRGGRRRHLEPFGDRRGGHGLRAALRERPDRLRVVLHGIGDLGPHGHHTLTRRPVAYMTSRPARRPALTSGLSSRPSRSRTCGRIWTITWAMAPAPTPNRSAATLGWKAEAPIHAPSTAGAPASRPSRASRPSESRARAVGATMARPSVVLWRAKPTTSAAPSASDPTAEAEPIASPSPRLWSPTPSATRK